MAIILFIRSTFENNKSERNEKLGQLEHLAKDLKYNGALKIIERQR